MMARVSGASLSSEQDMSIEVRWMRGTVLARAVDRCSGLKSRGSVVVRARIGGVADEESDPALGVVEGVLYC